MTGAERLLRRVRRRFAPPPTLTVSAWADRERRLPADSSAEPGQWRTDRAPYLRGIMDALTDPGLETVVVMKAAQLGLTEVLLNALGYHVAVDPCPILLLEPTLDLARALSDDRLRPMFRDTPSLRGKIRTSRAAGETSTKLHMTFPGGHVTLAGANSPASLSSRPIRLVLADEVDRYPAEVGEEGDPLSLAIKRTATFWNGTVVIVSSPTVKGTSRIEAWYGQSDQRRYCVPCPACGTAQVYEWRQVVWQGEDPATARIECVACRHPIDDVARRRSLATGSWRPTAPYTGIAGFHLSQLYSPWIALATTVADFLAARRAGASRLRVFVNTALAETWEEQGEQVAPHVLLVRREVYDAEVPAGACCLTAGVDTQDDRLEILVMGWGRGEESWVVDAQTLPGDPARPEPWTMLEEILAATYPHASGAQLPILATCIDSAGHRTDFVYDFVRRHQHQRVFAVIGRDGDRPIVSAPAQKRTGRNPRPVALHTVGVDMVKALLASRLQLTAPGPGFVHLPLQHPAIGEEFVAQLTAEKLVTRYRHGVPSRQWVQTRPRNEALDCFDEATETLTRDGWRPFAALTGDELLATVNLATDVIEYQKPAALIAKPYCGRMLHIAGRRVDILVTPKHRLVTYRARQETVARGTRKWNFDVPPEITLAQELTIHHALKCAAEWRASPVERVSIADGIEITARHLAELAAWYVADGSTSFLPGVRYRVILTCPGRKKAPVSALLDRLGLTWRFERFSFVFSSKSLCLYLREQCGVGAENKRVPQWVKDAPPDIIARFVDAAIAGDGWTQRKSRTYATISRWLADDMQELFIKLGRAANVKLRPGKSWAIRGRSGAARDQFHVSECRASRIYLDGGGNGRREFLGRWIDYEGIVYCATVPNGTLICRRNGKAFIAGNCAVLTIAALRLLNPRLDVMAARLAAAAPPTQMARQATQDEPGAESGAVPQPAAPPASGRRVSRSSYLGR